MAAPSTPPYKGRANDDDSSSSISPVLGHDSPFKYEYRSGKVIQGGDVVTYKGVRATVLGGNGGSNYENPQVKILQEDGKICCPSARSLEYVCRRRPVVFPPEPCPKEDQKGGDSPKPSPTPPVMPPAPAPLVVQPSPAQLPDDQEFISLFSRLNVGDKESVKSMIRNLASKSANSGIASA